MLVSDSLSLSKHVPGPRLCPDEYTPRRRITPAAVAERLGRSTRSRFWSPRTGSNPIGYVNILLAAQARTCCIGRTEHFRVFVRGCSSDGRALALHARGTGIDTPHLQFCSFALSPLSHWLRFHSFPFPDEENLKMMTAVGFEPTPPQRLVPKTSALDHSATLPAGTSPPASALRGIARRPSLERAGRNASAGGGMVGLGV